MRFLWTDCLIFNTNTYHYKTEYVESQWFPKPHISQDPQRPDCCRASDWCSRPSLYGCSEVYVTKLLGLVNRSRFGVKTFTWKGETEKMNRFDHSCTCFSALRRCCSEPFGSFCVNAARLLSTEEHVGGPLPIWPEPGALVPRMQSTASPQPSSLELYIRGH